MTEPLITCKELYDFLGEYVDETLAPRPRAEFERHLGVCPSCVTYLDTYRASVKLGKRAFCHPDDPPPPEVPAELIAAILAARRRAP